MISAVSMEKLPEAKAPGKLETNTTSSWFYDLEVMQRSAWKDINNYVHSQRQAWMTTILNTKKMELLEKYPRFAHKVFWNVFFFFCSYWQTRYFMVYDLTCSCGHKMDRSSWPTSGAFDLVKLTTQVNTDNIVMREAHHNNAE